MKVFRYENVEWSVPFLFNNQNFFTRLVQASLDAGINLPVKFVYGYINNRWNGNEFGIDKFPMASSAIEEIRYFNNVPVINFSNYHIEQSDLDDSYCNQLLEYGISKNAAFIISSDLLYDYIKNKYPQAKLIASDIKSLYEMQKGSEVEFYKNLYDKYELITLSPNYVKDGFIQDVEKYDDLSKFEVIVNHNCLKTCDKFKEHNELVENFEMRRSSNTDYMSFCPKKDISMKDGVLNTLVLNRQELDNLVYNIGIKHLKLLGYSFNPIMISEIMSEYIFETMGVFQHFSFILDDCNMY